MIKSIKKRQTYEKYPKVGTYAMCENITQKKVIRKFWIFLRKKFFFRFTQKSTIFENPHFPNFYRKKIFCVLLIEKTYDRIFEIFRKIQNFRITFFFIIYFFNENFYKFLTFFTC